MAVVIAKKSAGDWGWGFCGNLSLLWLYLNIWLLLSLSCPKDSFGDTKKVTKKSQGSRKNAKNLR